MRLLRITAVEKEYLAALAAALLLGEKLKADPSYGNALGWKQRAGQDFADNLEGTYIVRMYAEFEAGLRDYWKTYHGRNTHPLMSQLLNVAIPNQYFPQDRIDNADNVRAYRNFLVHDIEEEPLAHLAALTLKDAKRHLCGYFACLYPNWH